MLFLSGDHRGLVHSDQALRLFKLMVRAETMETETMDVSCPCVSCRIPLKEGWQN